MAKSVTKQMWMLIIVTLLIGIGFGCAGHKAIKNEASLEAAINKAWEARTNGDWNSLYALTSEAYQQKVKLEQFAKSNTINIESYTIKQMEIEGDTAKAEIDYQTRQGGFLFKFPAKESWIWEQNGWRLDLKEGTGEMPFMKKQN